MIEVWTLVAESSGRRDYDDPTVTVHQSERDAMAALRDNYDPEREFRFYPDDVDEYDTWVKEFSAFFNLDVTIEKHTVPHAYPELDGFTIVLSEDYGPSDMVLRHDACGVSLCDVEHGDVIDVYARLATEHVRFNANAGAQCTAHPLNPTKEN